MESIASYYMKDLCISYYAARMSLMTRRLLLAINSVSCWANISGFRFFYLEKVAMHYCHKRKVQPDTDLHVSNRRLLCVEAICYLGLVLVSRLTLMSQFRPILATCL